jgi:hypothetical protein
MAPSSYLAGWLLASAVLTSSCYLGVCRGRLDDVGYTCPTSFDGTAAGLAACRPVDHSKVPTCYDFALAGFPRCRPFEHSEIRTCGNLIELSSGPGLGGSGCYYSSKTHQLVGARQFRDIPTYCDRSSFERTAGRAPASGACPRDPTLVLECPAR